MGKIIELPVGSQFELGKAGNIKPDFHIFTAGIEPDRTNNRLVHMIGSSTERDMQGDVMSIHALNDMTKAPPNLTIWLNHDYTLPDSIFGSIVGRAGIMHQNGIADLHFDSDVELDNPAAARVKKYIDNGRRLGCSIGCMVTKYEVPDEETDGENWYQNPVLIHGVHVVEYSVVGIPCNQRSWVENAIRGVFTRTLDPRLAPAMKSLWGRTYTEVIDTVEQPTLRKQLLESPSRDKASQRIDWYAPTKTFVMSGNGIQKTVSREDLAAFFDGEKAEPEGQPFEEDISDEEIDTVIGKSISEIMVEKQIVTTPPLEDGDTSMKIIGYAVNKDGTAGIALKAMGNHDPTTGTHTHFHDTHGHGDVALHHHEHDHDNDNTHHHDHGDVPHPSVDGNPADPDNDGDVDQPGKKDSDAPTSKSLEPEVKKDVPQIEKVAVLEAQEPVEEKIEAVIEEPVEEEINPSTLAQLGAYNSFGKLLGLPEVTSLHFKTAQHPAVKAAPSNEHMGHITAIHDHAAAMGGCGYVNDTNVSDARNEAALGAGASVIGGDYMSGITDLSTNMGALAKAFDGLNVGGLQKDVEGIKKEFTIARKQLDGLYAEMSKAAETVAAIKNMPLGNPIHHSRTVHPEDNVTTRSELMGVTESQRENIVDNLQGALALTTQETKSLYNGTKISYRVWPAGVGGSVGKGVRPELTADQISFMNFEDVHLYRKGLEARVPMIDDPEENHSF